MGEFGLELVPVEEDVLSLELDGAFRDCVVDGDSSALFYAARALMRLQSLFGLIPRLQVGLWVARRADSAKAESQVCNACTPRV